ncbi:MAG: winged helix-turn-helix domain-containing protein [Bacteroidota bacterium]
MNVKSKITSRKLLALSLLCLLCAAIVALAPFTDTPDHEFALKRTHIAVRAIGDELLTHAQDNSSPVLPVQEIDEHTLRLSFQNPIAINPDSLSMLALTHLKSDIAQQAIVQVLDAASEEMVYGFEINHLEPVDIPCLGRTLPESLYHIDVSFYDQQPAWLGPNIFTAGILGFALVSITFLGVSFSRKNERQSEDDQLIEAKGVKLDLHTNLISFGDQQIKLTNKEAQIFSILLQRAGQLVSRDHLTQEVWLKEGVVTSRSLDMYISRLRKKIKVLPQAEIVNEHGRGYVLSL